MDEISNGACTGEIAAAYAAGLISAEQAILTAFFRGKAVSCVTARGAMLALGSSKEHVTERIRNLGLLKRVQLACENSPSDVTASGDVVAIHQLADSIQADGLFARELKTNHKAYHSSHMLSIQDYYEKLLHPLFHKTTTARSSVESTVSCTMVSTVTGHPVDHSTVQDARYWTRNLVSPVEFLEAVSSLSLTGSFQVVEIGPHSTLEMPLKKCWSSDTTFEYCHTLKRNADDVKSLISTVEHLFLRGHAIDFVSVNLRSTKPQPLSTAAPTLRCLNGLPRYNWSYDEVLWSEPRISQELRSRKHPRHPLLGSRIPGGSAKVLMWRNVFRTRDTPWVADHTIGPWTIFPGAAYIALAIEALLQANSHGEASPNSIWMHDLKFLRALDLSEYPNGIEIVTTIMKSSLTAQAKSGCLWRYEISSVQEGVWRDHASGNLELHCSPTPPSSPLIYDDIPMDDLAARHFYKRFDEIGFRVGPSFKSMTDLRIPTSRDREIACASTKVIKESPSRIGQRSSYVLHPLTIDAIFQTGALSTTRGDLQTLLSRIPVAIESLYVSAKSCENATSWLMRASSQKVGIETRLMEGSLYDQSGQLACEIRGIRTVGFNVSLPETEMRERLPMFAVSWKPDLRFSSRGLVEAIMEHVDMSKALTAHAFSQPTRLIWAIMDLVAHARPGADVLIISKGQDHIAKELKEVSQSEASSPTRQAVGSIDFSEALASGGESSTVSKKLYDLIVRTSVSRIRHPSITTKTDQKHKTQESDNACASFEMVSALAKPESFLVVTTESGTQPRRCEDYATIATMSHDDRRFQVMRRANNPLKRVNGPVSNNSIVVHAAQKSQLDEALQQQLGIDQSVGLTESSSGSSRPSSQHGATIIFTAFCAQGTAWSRMTEIELRWLQQTLKSASCLVFVTAGDLLSGRHPDHAIALGLARTVILEHPQLKVLCYDIDNLENDTHSSARNIRQVLEWVAREPHSDLEFIQRKDCVYVSRFVADIVLNERFRIKSTRTFATQALSASKSCRLSIESPGQFESLHFIPEQPRAMGAREVRIDTRAIGVNAKASISSSTGCRKLMWCRTCLC